MAKKHIFRVMLTTLLCNSIIVLPCYAARVYNETQGQITVRGQGITENLNLKEISITIPPGQRSDSLSWDRIGKVSVLNENNNQICSMEFKRGNEWHNEIVGGNYMVVKPSGCVVCDSNHKEISSDGQAPSCE